MCVTIPRNFISSFRSLSVCFLWINPLHTWNIKHRWAAVAPGVSTQLHFYLQYILFCLSFNFVNRLWFYISMEKSFKPSGFGLLPHVGLSLWVSRWVSWSLSLTEWAPWWPELLYVPAERVQTPAAGELPPPDSRNGPLMTPKSEKLY